jgi:DNA primase
MPRYTDDSRERVRDAVDFAELVGARTELRPAGVRRMTGLCPFHDERTPSFGIDPVEKLYHCFGCGEGGDVFKFVMETEAVDFTGALELLADRSGVRLEPVAEDPREAARRGRRDRLLELLERTASWYVRVLWESSEADGARAYLAERGLGEAALREYRVGFAPSSWDRVLLASRRAGYTEEELAATGLVQRNREGRVYDRFRRRIVFPLCDPRGRVLGFGARSLSADQPPKYLNSPESELFHKGDQVYGADIARTAAAKAGRVVLVEGYTDVIALHQAGIHEVVATMGTALTERQVEAIRRLAPTALLCQDPDVAGQEAVGRGAQVVEDANLQSRLRGLDLRVVRLPTGLDPADVAQRDGADAIRALLDGAVPLPRFRVDRALEGAAGGGLDGRERALTEATSVIRGLPASVLRDELVQLVAGRLDLSDALVESALRDSRPAAQPATGRPRNSGGAQVVLDRREQTERSFLALCVALPEEGERRLAAMDVDEFFSATASRHAAAYLRGRLAAPAGALPPDDEPLARLVAELVIRAGTLEATVEAIELEALQLDLSRLDRKIANARYSGEGEGVGAFAAERQKVRDAIRHRLQ